ncbi:uncharacterized protein si:ch211-193i15.1 [Pangasianodon hypophthalmus]|uniref:uncharacterized protein si:ch211-193i15.1 n=1 Tax=Pangasianodon hypophthalmus TaxID=310915 RepID=UPI00230776B6|nr:uncharacterized protein si:ch211-193i15.1 [Pangasianodon hypophthalmus]
MDGVLEATIALCGCKVLCSILCLPAFKDSISSVSLCCVSLLLFTDLSITMFLVYLWSAAPRPMSFHPSSDVIALRFMLFLSDTYEAVLMLTPLLVAVELLARLLWGGETVTAITDEKEAKEDTLLLKDVDGHTWETGQQQKGEEKGNTAAFLKALGFLGCLMLWFMCGTYAGSSWRQEQVMVRSCLERGSLLSTCLPCLLTASSPVSGQLFWALPAAILLLAFTAVLSLIVAKLTPRIVNPELLERTENFDALKQTQTHPPTPERTSVSAASISDNCSVDSEKTANSCAIHSSHNKRRWAHGKPEPLSWRTELADSCKLKSESVTLVLQVHCTAPHPHKSRLWQTVRESPCLRGELMTGLLCGLLVCIFPTVLSTNILLVSNLDTLAVYVVKHLLTPLHSK